VAGGWGSACVAGTCGGAGCGLGAALAAHDSVALRDRQIRPAEADRMAAECT
jgi:hypothetical protein